MPRFLLDSTKRASRRGLLGKLENIAVYLILFFLCFAAVILAFPANGQLQGKEIQVISAFLAGGDIAVLCVLCGMANAAYQRPDGVFVVPVTALKP